MVPSLLGLLIFQGVKYFLWNIKLPVYEVLKSWQIESLPDSYIEIIIGSPVPNHPATTLLKYTPFIERIQKIIVCILVATFQKIGIFIILTGEFIILTGEFGLKKAFVSTAIDNIIFWN